MDNEMMRYATGESKPAIRDRAVARHAKVIYDKVGLAGLELDGTVAFAVHAMEVAVQLNARKQALSNGDPVTNAVLSEFEAEAFRQIKNLQASLFNSWR